MVEEQGKEGSPEVTEEDLQEEERLRKMRVRREAEKLSSMVFTKETRDHLVRAGTEMILAIDSMLPRDLVPPDVKEHYLAAKRETILLVKALLDAQLEVVKDMEKEETDMPVTGLHKIELE